MLSNGKLMTCFIPICTKSGEIKLKKILFFIHDLGHGGAEKVLVNLVNNMDASKFNITVMTIFDVGVNKKYLNEYIRYISCFKKMFRGNSHLMKILSPKQLHRILIKDHYDIEVSFLEGVCARIVSGCPNEDTKLVTWIHTEFQDRSRLVESFRTYQEAETCYNRFHKIVCVSQTVKDRLNSLISLKAPVCVLYNTSEYDKILRASHESVKDYMFSKGIFSMVAVGKLQPNKGIDRLLKIANELKEENYSFHLYILGTGPEEGKLKKYVKKNGLLKYVDFLGYQENPYKYIAKCDLFVCASYREGFSTSATEALITGTAICTVNVSGMSEMLGENNEYGIVVENDDVLLLNAIKHFMDSNELVREYSARAFERGKIFSVNNTVWPVEAMLLDL